MLDQVTRWIAVVGTVTDAVLLVRILALRLHQMYLFVTLYCTVTLVLDAGTWLSGWNSPASLRILVYSRFVMTLVFPLAAWDVFQAVSGELGKIRRFHTLRMVSGLVITGIFALVLAAVVDDQDMDGIASSTIQVALLLWVATSSASLLFLWNMRRYMRKQQITLGGNTAILWVFFLVTLIEEVLSCFLQLTSSWFSPTALSAIEIVVGCVDIAIVVWCAIKLRSVQTAAAQQNAGA